MKPIDHQGKKFKYVNEKVVDGVTYTAYRYRPPSIVIERPAQCVVMIDGKLKPVQDLDEFWESLNG